MVLCSLPWVSNYSCTLNQARVDPPPLKIASCSGTTFPRFSNKHAAIGLALKHYVFDQAYLSEDSTLDVPSLGLLPVYNPFAHSLVDKPPENSTYGMIAQPSNRSSDN